MKKYCYINGKITEEKNAHVSPHDLGILRGYGVFDFMCTTNGKPFLLRDHWHRLNHSARSLHIPVPITEKEYEDTIHTLLKKNNMHNAGIKTILTAGISDNGFTPLGQPTFYILLYDLKNLAFEKELYENGAKIITHQFTRSHPTSKTTEYIEALKNHQRKIQKNAIEILYIDGNTVLECATSNIFIIKNKKLITPKDAILPGVTRKIVLKITRKAKIPTQEKKISLNTLLNADEVFITGSAKHILPITKVNTKKIGNGKPGDITRDITRLYFDYFNNY